MLAWLETSPVGDWVALSLYAYPLLLSLHIVGLAVVVGIFSMRDLRLLGIVSGLQPSAFLSLSRLAWIGFTLNAISGLLLFTSQATVFASSVPFLTKISCVTAGMVLAGIIQSRLRAESEDTRNKDAITGSTRALALASLLLWVSAIIAGRLIAYL
ncbi:MAG: hypothetical protein O2971_18660 [Proteobacteria bacterium]|nr:hypothetical protein [Pseudomonadota bacterium]